MKKNYEDEEPFKDLLARYRNDMNMSQSALADCLGITRGTVAKWEQGNHLPKNRARILDLARCLQLTDQQHHALLRSALLRFETSVTDEILAVGERLDWEMYLRALVRNYVHEDRFKNYIPLRKFDAVEQIDHTQRKVGLLKLDLFVDHWLKDNQSPHLAILGGYGAGKTWYCHHLAHRLATSYLDGDLSERVPVLITLKFFTEAADLPSVLERFWDHVGYGDFDLFKQAVYQGDVLVILDGFDEMSLDFRKHVQADNFAKLRRLFTGKSKIIITSRDTYFTCEAEQKRLLASLHVSPLDTGLLPTSQEIPIPMIYLDGFNKNEIYRYFTLLLGKEQGEVANRQIHDTYDLLDLAGRPILANIIAMTLPHFKQGTIINAALLYERYTTLWMERECWRLPDVNIVRTFMQHFALDLQLKEAVRFRSIDTEAAPQISDDLFDFMLNNHFHAYASSDDDFQDIKRKIQNCSFLTHDSSGTWDFIHRSFMEFFCAQKCYADFVTGAVDVASSFPLTEDAHSILGRFTDGLLPITRSAQARFVAESSPDREIRDFFSEMLVSNDKVNEFGQFLICSRITVWGYRFFEDNQSLESIVDPSVLERLESDFEWDYYLRNCMWYDISPPNSPRRIQYVDQP